MAGAPEAEAYAEMRQRLNCSTFVPRVDLAAGSYLVLTAGNCTGPPTKTEVRVESSPYGKVTRVQWLPDVRSINVSLAQAVWAQEPITLWFPAHANLFLDPLVCPDNPDDLLEDLFASPALLPPAGSIGDAEAEAMPETHEELERVRAGTVMRLVGLKSAPHYNGRRVVMMGRGLTRYTVRLLDSARKILVRASNLKPIDSSDPLFAESLAAGQAMDIMNRLYNSTPPVLPTPQGPGASVAGDGLDAALGMPAAVTAAMGGDGHALTDQDIRFLQRLNISVVDKAHFWETGHCDGGLGRIMVTPVNIAEEDEGNDFWAEPDADVMLGTRAPPQQPRELLLNLELQRAAACGDADRIETLVSAGADIHTRSFTDSQHGDFGRQPLHVAAWEGHVDACAVLLHMGADVHARDKNNATALHHAAVKGVLPTVEMLLEHGAVPTALNKWNRTCIHRAVFYNHKAVAVRLLDAAGPAYDRREIAAIEKHKILSHKRIDELRHMD